MKKYNQFLERLGLKTPIIQAPMANVSTPQVAAEIHKAGGLGSLPMSPINLTKGVGPIFDLIDVFRDTAGPKAPVNCNFFCFSPSEQHVPTQTEVDNWKHLYNTATGVSISEIDQKVPSWIPAVVSFSEFEQKSPTECSQFVDDLIALKPGVVLFHFGVPSTGTIKQFQNGGVLVLATATSVAEARHLIECGVDGIVCQGYEAGGHRGNYLVESTLDENLSTSPLFDLVLRVVGESSHQPYVIPAGGIVNGETAALYLKKGAAAVQLGTVFISVLESGAPPFIANAVKSKSEIPTIMTKLVSGRLARTLATPFIRNLMTEQEKKHYDLPTFGYSTSGFKKFANGKPDYGFYLAGENYHFIETGKTTAEVVRKISGDIRSHL